MRITLKLALISFSLLVAVDAWAQTNSRYGQLTFFTGIASDGEAWVGYNRRVGWTTINRFSSSGSSGKFTCSRIAGC